MTTIYMDESGHTGYNYLDRGQAVLAYGAMRLAEEQVDEFCARYFAHLKMAELKHSRLGGRASGQQAILSFLDAEKEFIQENFQWFLIHKPYALLSKYVDLLIENALRVANSNMYSSGMNQSLVSLIWMSAIAKGRMQQLLNLLTRFSQCARSPSRQSLVELVAAALELDLGDETNVFVRLPFDILGPRVMSFMRKEDLDLSFTGSWTLTDIWWRTVGEPFHLIHDAGAALMRQRDQWAALTRPDLPYESKRVGPFEVPINIPLVATDFVNSADCPPLQIVDIVLGSRRKLAEWLFAERPRDAYAERLFEVIGDPGAEHAIMQGLDMQFPTDNQTAAEADATLEALGTRLPKRRRYEPPAGETNEDGSNSAQV